MLRERRCEQITACDTCQRLSEQRTEERQLVTCVRGWVSAARRLPQDTRRGCLEASAATVLRWQSVEW